MIENSKLYVLLLVSLTAVIADSDRIHFPTSSENTDTSSEEFRERMLSSRFGSDEDTAEDFDAGVAEQGAHYQGDIQLRNNQKISVASSVGARTGLVDETSRWPKNSMGYVEVPFVIDNKFSQQDVRRIKGAISHMAKYTCIRFVDRIDQKDYVHFGSVNGCFSLLGRNGGRQIISLDRGCMEPGTVLHEMIHALGYTHMHNHKDRDRYLDIYWDNIKEERKNSFKKVDQTEYSDFGTSFDFRSLMMYHPTAFSQNGKYTMVPKKKSYMSIVGQRKILSAGDQRRINNMYDCTK